MARHRDEKPTVIIDTLGKIKRPKHPGEEAYLVDYEIGGRFKKLADMAPGATVLVVHHTRKAEVVDFIDSVSGTHGIAGSVDFVMVLSRKRLSNDAILSVTGRDIPEAEYALHADDGVLWRINGVDLDTARKAAQEQKAKGSMSDLKMSVFQFVMNWRGPEPVRATEVATALKISGDTASKNLRRLADDGWITKVGLGQYQYFVSEVSEVSDSTKNGRSGRGNESDRKTDTVSEVSESREGSVSECPNSDTSDSSDNKDRLDTSRPPHCSSGNGAGPSSAAANSAYRVGLCVEGCGRKASPGRPRCNQCHATYLHVMAGYDQ